MEILRFSTEEILVSNRTEVCGCSIRDLRRGSRDRETNDFSSANPL